MLKLLKSLFKNKNQKSDYEKRLEREQEERDRLKEIYTSDLYQYEYETDKQKVLKQIYPNKANVEILLGFYKPQKTATVLTEVRLINMFPTIVLIN